MPNDFSPTIFLDSNALHNILSYLIQARQRDLFPYNKPADLETIRQNLRKDLPQSMANLLIAGLKLLAYLQYQSEQEQAQVFTSRFSIAEMWYGRLEGQAHYRMALSGIPFRHRQRQSDKSALAMSKLTQGDFLQVAKELDNITQSLSDEFGINVQLIEDNNDPNPRDVAQLALELQRRTFLDVIDCYLFAGALSVLATEFVTSDAHLQHVINKLKNPTNIQDQDEKQLWEIAQRDILIELQKLLLNSNLDNNDLVIARKSQSLTDYLGYLHLK